MSKHLKIVSLVALLAVSVVTTQAEAAWLGLPANFKTQIDKIMIAKPAVAPFAFGGGCIRYTDTCRFHDIAFHVSKPVLFAVPRLDLTIDSDTTAHTATFFLI